jgi:hypothetical protein
MRLTLTFLALAASVIAAPIAVPEAEAEAVPQGTYGSYGTSPTSHVSMSKGYCETDMSVGTYGGAPATPPAGGYGSYGTYAPPAGGYGKYGSYGTYKS